ncbi:unnamed protein product [Pleuronectes platessa]|uniref:Uncharacterized protein n=1 Tax=Pleuronectes platessa TaxID=8262 RepID=A0A9N7YFY7_PLEPL|nr:unnamed protein product [Pleuronectes platessa]
MRTRNNLKEVALEITEEEHDDWALTPSEHASLSLMHFYHRSPMNPVKPETHLKPAPPRADLRSTEVSLSLTSKRTASFFLYSSCIHDPHAQDIIEPEMSTSGQTVFKDGRRVSTSSNCPKMNPKKTHWRQTLPSCIEEAKTSKDINQTSQRLQRKKMKMLLPLTIWTSCSQSAEDGGFQWDQFTLSGANADQTPAPWTPSEAVERPLPSHTLTSFQPAIS